MYSLTMVRFHWHVDSGHSAYIPANGIELNSETGVRNLVVEMEVRI